LHQNEIRSYKRLYLFQHFDLLLGSTWPWYNQSSTIYFIILSLVLFTVSTLLYFRTTSFWYLSAVFGLLTSSIPYIILFFVLFRKRSETSYELVPAVNLLLGKYRVNSKDIYRSLIDTIREMDQHKTLQKSLIKLASAIQSHRTREDLERAVEVFVYQIGTSWAQQLGVLLLNAQWESKDIELSLSNIVKDMGKALEIMEQQKSSNQDTIQMGYFIPIIVFPASLFFLAKATTSGRYLYFQFKTTVGFTSFIITFVLCLVGLIVSLLLNKPRNEI